VTKILKSKLLANDSDPDNDPLTIAAFSPTTSRGGTVATDNTGLWLFYIPFAGATNGDTDTFTYTASDGFGGVSTATVFVFIQAANPNVIPNNIVTAHQNNDGSIFMRFLGITGRSYKVQASVTFLNPNWQDLPVNSLTVDPTKFATNPANNTIVANDAGFVEYTDIEAPSFPTRFYRALVVTQ